MASDYAQDFLFNRIREILPQQVSLVDTVAGILCLSNDSAYRRIRGETPLVLEEIRKLCHHFHLSLDQLFHVKTGSTLFQAMHVDKDTYDFEKFLRGILMHLDDVTGYIHKEIIYLTKDIPLFHFFSFPNLFAFRYFFWMKSILQHPGFINEKFSFDCLTPVISTLAAEIIEKYNQVPSVEVWNTECVNSVILQVEYYKDAGYFSANEDIVLIYQALEQTLFHLRDQAEAGCKFLPSEKPQARKENFKFFHNRLVLGDTTILVTTDHLKTVFLNYDVLSYMVTKDDNFCEQTYQQLQNLIKRSTMISTVSEKQRNMFFNSLNAKIAERLRHL